MSRITDFYRGSGQDGFGRLIGYTWAFGHDKLERVHDFIQWLFPLREPSAHSHDAPTLSDKDVEDFRSDKDIRDRLRVSLDLMLEFYGLAFDPDPSSPPTVLIMVEKPWWARAGDHNLLRLTRILRSTRTLGLEAESDALLVALEQVAASHPGAIPERTLELWRASKGAK